MNCEKVIQLSSALYEIQKQTQESISNVNVSEVSDFFSISVFECEITIIKKLKKTVFNQSQISWRALSYINNAGFDESGVLLSIISPLSKSNIGVFSISIYSGDVVLVQEKDLKVSKKILEKHGFKIVSEK